MTHEELEAEFAPRGILRGGLLMLAPDDAIAHIRRACDARITVLGIDAFRITERSTRPFMEHSVDYTTSEAPAPPDPRREAKTFLPGYRYTELVFEVVLDSPALSE